MANRTRSDTRNAAGRTQTSTTNATSDGAQTIGSRTDQSSTTKGEQTNTTSSTKAAVIQTQSRPFHIGLAFTVRIWLDGGEPITPSAEGVAYEDQGPDC